MLDLSFPHHTTGLEECEWTPQVGSTGARCTYCVQDWAGGRDWWKSAPGQNSWCPRWLRSQIQGAIRYGDPRSHFLKASKGLGTCKRIIIVPESGCHGDQTQWQQDLLGLELLPLASPVSQSCRAKSLFHLGPRKNAGLALSQLQKRVTPSFPAFHVRPIPCSQSGTQAQNGGYPPLSCSLDDLWQVTFPLSSNVCSLRHPWPSLARPHGGSSHPASFVSCHRFVVTWRSLTLWTLSC